MNTIFKLEKNPDFDSTLNNTCTISGYVLDRNTKEPLIGANISLSGGQLGAASYIDGSFSIKNIPPGKYSIKVGYVGYRSYTKNDVWLEANYRYTLNVELVLDFYY